MTGLGIQAVDAALGGSAIGEELRGDLARARREAERALEVARTGRDPGPTADASISLALVRCLQGEVRAALEELERVAQQSSGDAVRALRATSHAELALILRDNYLPDGAGLGGAEFEARQAGFLEAMGKLSQRRAAALQGVRDPRALLEASVSADLLVNLPPARSFTGSPDLVARPDADQLLQTALSIVAAFEERARSLGSGPSLGAYARLTGADLARRAARPDLARQMLSDAEAAYRSADDDAGVGLCRMTAGDWLAAPFTTPLTWNHMMQEGIQSSRLAWSIERREVDRNGVDRDAADAAYSEAETLFRTAGAPRALAALGLRQGYLAVLGGDFTSALEQAERARDEFEAVGDGWGVRLASAHRALAQVGSVAATEDVEGARALGIWGRREGSFSYALGLGLLFARECRAWLIREGDYERALSCARLAEALFESLGATLNEAQSLVDQGETFRTIGDRASALHAYEQAWDRYSAAAATDPGGGGRIVRERGLMLGTEIYQMHLDGMDADGMSTTQSRLEEFMAATPTQPEGLLGGLMGDMVGQSVRNLVGQNAVLVPLYRAVASRDAGDDQAAGEGFDAALEAARGSDPSQRGFLEAVVLGTAHRYREAADAYRRHLEGSSGPGGSLMDLMAGLLGGGERVQAEAREQQRNVHEQAAAMFTRLRAYQEAMAHFDALRDLGGPEWWRGGSRPWESLSDIAEVLEGLERFDEALQGYERAIEELEARRALLSLDELKTALSGGRGAQYLYFQAARTAMKLAEREAGGAGSNGARRWLAKGFELAERGKARSLVDLMAAGAERTGRGQDRDAIRAWREATTRLAAWRGLLALERTRRDPGGPDPELLSDLTARLEAGEDELLALRKRLAREDPGLHRALNPQADVAPVDEVAGLLLEGTALILYSYLGEDLLAWAISSTGIVAHHRGPLDQRALDRRIRAFHGACERGEPAVALGQPLSDALLLPMEAAIQAHDHLILVPSGAAHSLPFHALPWGGGPLGADRVVSYLPSAGALRFLPPRGADLGIGRLLAVGNPARMAIRTVPAGEVQTLAPLPAAAAEAAYVAALVPDGRALIGAQATEPTVRSALEGAGVLHFATHAHLSEELPLLSSVVLADGEALTLLDLMGLRLDAGLVVLSACRTALGETTGGDDVLGLTRGLLAAGARAAVVSLWPVDDVSTGLLMGHFYRRLMAGDGAAAALQAAQAHLRELTPEAMSAERAEMAAALVDAGGDTAAVVVGEPVGSSRDVRRRGGPIGAADYGHPHYWAPFVLVGV